MKLTPTKHLHALPEKLRHDWADALMNGGYEQGRSRLASEPQGPAKWCCLGVLAHEVLGVEQALCSGLGLLSALDSAYGIPAPAGMTGRAWNRIQERLDRVEMVYDEDDRGYTFPALNDTAGLSFAAIARLLRGEALDVERAETRDEDGTRPIVVIN